MLDILNDRRTIRKYTEKDVSEELLNELLNAACRASTTGTMQVYSVIETRSQEMKEKLSPCHFNQPMVKEAPVLLTFCADFNRFNHWCRQRKAEPGYDNFLSFITASIDAIIAAQTLCVAAEAKGLGICYLGTTTYMAGKIIEILELPAGVVPVTTITLGWPAEKPEQTDRLPLNAVLHKEKYCDYTEQDIDRIYAEKEARADSRQFVKENDKETLAQVFTEVRYKKEDNETFSKLLIKVLEEQRFLK